MPFTILKRAQPWDAIVIGSGATGGWAAWQLGRRGLSVLVLEAGPDGIDAPTTESALRLRAKRFVNGALGHQNIQSRIPNYWDLDPDLFVLDTEHPYRTPEGKRFDWIRTRAVNGRLLTWGGIGVRVSDYEFKAAEGDGFGETWPFGYEELERHYDEIDDFFAVYGEEDSLPQLPDGKYVGPPRLTEAEHRFREAVSARFTDRQVIASRGVLVRPSSRPNGESPPPSPLRAAMKHHGVNLRTNAVVSHILVDTDGRATGVAFFDRLTKRSHEVSCRAVAVCASTLETTRVLLNSASSQHPDGLGNSSGSLGRHLMDHCAVLVTGTVPGNGSQAWADGSGGPKNIMIPRFHNLENKAGGAFLRGYGIFGGIGRGPSPTRKRRGSNGNEVPFGLVAYGEMLPRSENRVSLDRENRDAWGIPTLHIDCEYSSNEHAMIDHMLASMQEMIDVAGGHVGATHRFAPGGFVHETGTARMGSDPRASVLNGFGQCWDADNVYVMDGAAWPTSAWQNPTFTMMALAGRASEHLAESVIAKRI